MTNSNYGCRVGCVGIAVVAAILIGAVTAILAVTAVIASTPAFLWVAFGIGFGALALTYITSAFGDETVKCCISDVFPALITGILGTLLTALVLLAVKMY